MEDFFNQTFPGLELLYRDVELSKSLISKYKVGQIIQERGFVDTTKFGGGISTSLRYIIASAHGKGLSAFDSIASKCGLILISPGAYFKVLDICMKMNKTQILLLQIPEAGVELFSSTDINLEQQIIEKAQQRFDEQLNAEPIAELLTDNWKERTKFPIGMDDLGNFFSLSFEEKIEKSNSTENKPKSFWKKFFGK